MKKKLKTTQIAELLELENPETQLQHFFDWAIDIKKDDETMTINVWDSLTWRRFFEMFYDWSYVWLEVGETDFYKAFGLILTDFKKNHEEGLKRTLEAFWQDYAPLENYDKHVDESITDKGTDTSAISYGKKLFRDQSAIGGTSSQMGKIINPYVTSDKENTISQDRDVESIIKDKDENELLHISNGAFTNSTDSIEMIKVGGNFSPVSGTDVKTTTSVSTYDANKKDVDEVENTGSTSIMNQSRSSGREFNAGADLTTTNKNDITTRDYHEHGNIGVTTAQQMLQAEYELRMGQNFEDDMLNRFAYECLVLMP